MRQRRRSKSVLDSFAFWLQDHAVYSAPEDLVRGVLGILSLGALLSALLGVVAIKASVIVTVVLGVVGLCFVLVTRTRESSWNLDRQKQLLTRYCDTLEKRHGQQWTIKRWIQQVDVDSHGDVHERISITVVAACEQLDFFTFVNGPNWEWPEKLRRDVKVEVRTAEGSTRADVTSVWLSRGRFKSTVHLREPVALRGEASVVVDVVWPAKCLPLMLGRCPEDFVLTFGDEVPYVEYAVALPAGYQVKYDKVGLVADQQCSLVGTVNRSGQVQTVLTVHDLPKYQKAGMRLDLSQETT